MPTGAWSKDIPTISTPAGKHVFVIFNAVEKMETWK